METKTFNQLGEACLPGDKIPAIELFILAWENQPSYYKGDPLPEPLSVEKKWPDDFFEGNNKDPIDTWPWKITYKTEDRVRYLFIFDDWGMGYFDSDPEISTGHAEGPQNVGEVNWWPLYKKLIEWKFL